jgi:hypothetical protein
MKFQAISVSPRKQVAHDDTEVVMLKVSGPVDRENAVMRRARELVVRTGSQTMIDSFDWAIDRNAFVTED